MAGNNEARHAVDVGASEGQGRSKGIKRPPPTEPTTTIQRTDAPRPGRKTLRADRPSTPAIPEPIEIAKFWKNRRGEAVVVVLKSWENLSICDLRQYFTAPDGRLQPTKKGLAINVLRLPELAAAINKALAKARELGVVPQ